MTVSDRRRLAGLIALLLLALGYGALAGACLSGAP